MHPSPFLPYSQNVQWLLGDLQGCVDALESFIQQSAFDPAKDSLWCVGDLINRGPHSRQTLRLWKDIGGRAVLGNHEIYALGAYHGKWPRKPGDTLDELFQSSEGQELLAELMQCPILHPLQAEGGERIWAVHGGVHPQWSHNLDEVAAKINAGPYNFDRLVQDEVRFATRVRCCDREGNRSSFDEKPEDCPPPYQPWDELYEGQERIVHGHWAWRGHYVGTKSIGLDNGYVYGRSVWAFGLEEGRFLEIKHPGL